MTFILIILQKSCEESQGIMQIFYFILWENAGFAGPFGIIHFSPKLLTFKL